MSFAGCHPAAGAFREARTTALFRFTPIANSTPLAMQCLAKSAAKYPASQRHRIFATPGGSCAMARSNSCAATGRGSSSAFIRSADRLTPPSAQNAICGR